MPGRGRQSSGVPATSGSGKKRVYTGTRSESVLRAAGISQNDNLIPASEVPAVGAEEVVMTNRGMPTRLRKRNQGYTEDCMTISSDEWSSVVESSGKKMMMVSEPTERGSGGGEEDEILGDIPGITFSPVVNEEPTDRGASQSAALIKSSGRRASAKKVAEPPPERLEKRSSGRRSVIDKGSSQRSSQHSLLALITSNPELESRTSSAITSSTPEMKVDPDGPSKSIPLQQKNVDKWENLAKKADSLRKTREKRETEKRSTRQGKSKDCQDDQDNYDSKNFQRLQQEREGLEKETGRKDAAALKEPERLAKERIRKETEKNALRKEVKWDYRQPPPPVVGQASRQAYSGRQYRHHNLSFSQQPLMAVLHIDDTANPATDRLVAHDNSLRLRNLLKLPKAHKWVCYEWFYSNIDKALFEGENDFQVCLRESFPGLKTRNLTKAEWRKVRKLLGKPRRCSQSFFDEERVELTKRRAKIRLIQQRKFTDFNCKELPDEIPLQLVIGTKVTARLRRPQDGLFAGTIEGVDPSNNTYRITFDRQGLGTQSVPDFEVLSNDPPETMSTSSFALKLHRRNGFTIGGFKFQNPVLLDDQPKGFPKSAFPADGKLGGFPIRLLDMIVRFSKLLKVKREKIMALKELNVEAEKLKSYGRPYDAEYQTRYARCVISLDSINKAMAMYLTAIQAYCIEITNDPASSSQMVVPDQVLDSCRQEASMVVSTYNNKQNRTLVHNPKIVGLIQQLTSLMLQVRSLSNADKNLYQLKSLQDTIKDVKASLEGRNLQCFQNKIEIPMNRIMAGLCAPQSKTFDMYKKTKL